MKEVEYLSFPRRNCLCLSNIPICIVLVFLVTLLRSVNHKVNSFLTADKVFTLHNPRVRYGLLKIIEYI